jgi:hypothetical protein
MLKSRIVSKKVLLVLATLLLGAGLAFLARGDLKPVVARLLAGEWRWFESSPLPVDVVRQVYDLGVVDANGDGILDLYSSNHNYRQVLLIADGKGGYRDVLTEWGLDQSRALPGAEQSWEAPVMVKPGFYIFWVGDTLRLVAHRLEELGPVRGVARFFNLVEIVSKDGFETKNQVHRPSSEGVDESALEFSASRSGQATLYLHARGAPVTFRIDAPWARTNVFVGSQGVVPSPLVVDATGSSSDQVACATNCLTFELTLRDRHSMVWADYDGDGSLDVFINRGALGGQLRKYPPTVRDEVSDELFLSEGGGRLADRARQLGIEKKDCSGRHAKWVDFDGDGLLDLYINCQDRGSVPGGYPKQLYRQGADGHLTDVASAAALDLPNHQIVDMAWFDADGDGVVDLFTHEDEGYFLYRNRGGSFHRQFIHRGKFERADVEGLKGNTSDYWQFDGKLSVADLDSDGDLDVFVASKKGNVLLVNEGEGHFEPVVPSSVGLPDESVAAAWVDFDNDGRPDLHAVPQGLFRQDGKGKFSATGLLALPESKYMAAIVNWFDRDNDGNSDVVVGTLDNPSLWRWWEKPFKHSEVKGKDDRFDWKIHSYRNLGHGNHWLQLQLVGSRGNPQAIGAKVTVDTKNGRQVQQVGASEGSQQSQGHYRLYFGLGDQGGVDAITIRWPNGQLQELRDVRGDQLVLVRQDNRP